MKPDRCIVGTVMQVTFKGGRGTSVQQALRTQYVVLSGQDCRTHLSVAPRPVSDCRTHLSVAPQLV